MLNWFKPKILTSEEYDKLTKRVIDLDLRILELETFQGNIRNMARKIQTHQRKQEEAVDEQEKKQDNELFGGVLLPE